MQRTELAVFLAALPPAEMADAAFICAAICGAAPGDLGVYSDVPPQTPDELVACLKTLNLERPAGEKENALVAALRCRAGKTSPGKKPEETALAWAVSSAQCAVRFLVGLGLTPSAAQARVIALVTKELEAEPEAEPELPTRVADVPVEHTEPVVLEDDEDEDWESDPEE